MLFRMVFFLVLFQACEGEKSTNSRSLSNVEIGVSSSNESKVIPHTEDKDIQTLNGSIDITKDTFESPVKVDLQDTGETSLMITMVNAQLEIPDFKKDVKVCINIPQGIQVESKLKVSRLDGGDAVKVDGVQSSKQVCIQTQFIPGLFALVPDENTQLGETLTYAKDF
ncbi:MAG: hypothetical protein AB8C84_11555, partial [Oligoflexales bacterium]